VILAGCDRHGDERIALFQADGDDSTLANIRIGAQRRLLHRAVGGREHQELLGLGKILD
jgi:hypothetical protein